MKYMSYKALQDYDLEKGKKPRIIADLEKISENILFDNVNEEKFFRLLIALCKNCDENIAMFKKIQTPIEDYL